MVWAATHVVSSENYGLLVSSYYPGTVYLFGFLRLCLFSLTHDEINDDYDNSREQRTATN